MSVFDFVLLLIISNAVQNAMVGPDTSLAGGLVAAGVLMSWHWVINRVRLRDRRLAKLIAGEGFMLIYHGKILDEHCRRAGITRDDLLQALREHGVARVEDVMFAVLEPDGAISVVRNDDVKPGADPHIHNLKWDAGAPLTFEFHVEVKPDLTLERIGKFQLKRTVPKVTEDQALAQLNELREQKAPWTPVAGEKPRLKDLVHVTIATREGGEAKDPQPYQLVLGEGRAIPDVEERIMGLLPGETVDATVRFPSDFPEEAKRGQSRDVRITLHEVKRQQLPELDDAFAREVGDFESLEALRRAVREDLERDAQREADARVRAELIEQIVAANRIAAPRPLVERALYVYAQAYGIPEGRVQQFAAEFRPVAEAQVRRDLILDWVVEHHGLRATEAELEQKVQEIAARSGTSTCTSTRPAASSPRGWRSTTRCNSCAPP